MYFRGCEMKFEKTTRTKTTVAKKKKKKTEKLPFQSPHYTRSHLISTGTQNSKRRFIADKNVRRQAVLRTYPFESIKIQCNLSIISDLNNTKGLNPID